ncbi:glycerol-3-phosphate dehydrogenase/oxidase [Tessaracoccus flavus]|uniref:Glycerol-3-phosphate dehydrogenase n=1 Tax=Tessaracoccus flavus TaxID=1610493 RepID=A0A1Q2CHW5_9ACTN|nr:glycerol-3-phosphate dehydrogenase/oxidase [Tessaracoccus flavus]AQP45702.1 glycerol-3-phosphate dehydrogenase [Tessaracoccus flavus]SDZ13314.1 glycerol-3-phosphate dehydrogenase [Tessaracoccus flavus]
MTHTALTPEQRSNSLSAMSTETFDVLVIGGGVTGAGIALDAASRGLRTAVIEAQDWAAGTSSRSSRLIHGGLRYLYNLDFKLVAEALTERGRLLTKIAPHLVEAQPFLWPLKQRVIERAYSAVGVGLYDVLAVAGAGGKKTVPIQRHLSKKGAMRRFPDVKPDALIGAIEFYDARVDDARMVIALVRTALQYGAEAASRVRVTEVTKGSNGRVDGVRATDLETGEELRINAKRIINATGVWTEETQDMAGGTGGLKVLASKGIHIVIPRDRIKAKSGMFLRTEKSVLFIIPWQHYWVIGTTDTAWHEQLKHPVPTSADIDYVLAHANEVLAKPLTRDDIIGTYAGLRPLLQPKVLDESKSTKVSREHTVTEVAPGMVAIAGGKYTTYRVMAEDAVDFALGEQLAKAKPSITADLPLLGAPGLEAMRNQAERLGAQYGFDADRMKHLLSRYGSELGELLESIDEDESLGKPLAAAPQFLRAEVHRACTVEGALHLEDIFIARVRLNSESRDRGGAAVDEVAEIAAKALGWDEARVAKEKENYRARIAAELAAEEQTTDEAASAERMKAEDIVG